MHSIPHLWNLMLLKRKLTDEEMENLCGLLEREGKVRIDQSILRDFLSHGEILKLRAGDPIGKIHSVDTNHYVVMQGILRRWHWEKGAEKTSAFALPGTIFVDYHSYCRQEPAIYVYEACCDTLVIRIRDSVYSRFLDTSPEFVKWILSVSEGQLYCYEEMDEVINGNIADRYQALVEHLPDIPRYVSLKIIASYLGVTPQYLSMIRNQLRSQS